MRHAGFNDFKNYPKIPTASFVKRIAQFMLLIFAKLAKLSTKITEFRIVLSDAVEIDVVELVSNFIVGILLVASPSNHILYLRPKAVHD